jgi:signal transduction histidine kinase/streptogramin lyase
MPDKYSRSLRLAYAVILLFASSAISPAPAETLPLKHFTTSDGLAHDRVNRIVRDSRGLLWFCTAEGLSRFDGYQFKNYTRDEGMPHRSITDFLELPDGRYWVATGDGLVLFNPQGLARRWRGFENNSTTTDESLMFRVFRPTKWNPGTNSWHVTRLQMGGMGTLWVLTSAGLYRADQEGGNWKLNIVEKQEWRGKIDFDSLLYDKSGGLWLGGVDGLYRILPDGKVQIIDRQMSIISLLQDSTGIVWAGTRGESQGGLYQFVVNGLDQPKLAHTFTTNDGLSANHWLNALLETTDGTFWVGVGNGLCERVAQAGSNAPMFRQIWEAGITALGEDIGGNLWIGTDTGGAVRLSRKGFKSFDEKDGLKSTRVSSIINGRDGELFILTGNTIHRFDDGKFTSVIPNGIVPTTWNINQINFQDHLGEWWIAGAGLQRYPTVARMEDLSHARAKRLYTVRDGLPSDALFSLFEDSRGDIWIGTLSTGAENLARWERATDKFHIYTAKDGVPDHNAPTAFGEDLSGNIWIGYYGGGLVRYRNGTFQALSEQDGAPAGFIGDIHTDRRGRVWIASSASGIAYCEEPNAERPKLSNISTSEGLSSNNATCVTEDNFGRIYVGTGRGVNRLDRETGRVKAFTTADGLVENSVNLCERDKNGALWFGFLHGVSLFVPEPDIQTAPPPIFISDVIVNGTVFRKLSELGNAVVENLNLAADQRQIQINFFALGFSTGETLRYQYKLDDTDWSSLSALRTVNLNLSPGAHRFLVRAVNAEGVSSTIPALVSLSIARPVWQRGWFITLSVLLMAVGLFSFYRYRMARLREVNAALLEANVAEENLRKSKEERLRELELVRKRIASDLHDDIGSSLTQISLLTEVVNQRIDGSDEGVTRPLTMIANSSRELVDAMSDIVWAINPQKDHLSDLTQRMRSLISELSTFSSIRFSFRMLPLDLDVPLGANLRREIFLIFKESVNNIVKHAGATEAELEFRVEGNQLFLSVMDNGRGFDLAQENDGHGLISMRTRAESIGGKFDLVSAAGKGTTIIFRAPIEETSMAG